MSADGQAAGGQEGSALAGGCWIRPVEFEESRGHVPEIRVRRRARGWECRRINRPRCVWRRRRRGSGGKIWLVLQGVRGGISLSQGLADIRHPSERGSRVSVEAVVVDPFEEGVGQVLDDRVVSNARRGVGAGGGRERGRGEGRSRRKAGARGRRDSEDRVHERRVGRGEGLREQPVEQRRIWRGWATSAWGSGTGVPGRAGRCAGSRVVRGRRAPAVVPGVGGAGGLSCTPVSARGAGPGGLAPSGCVRDGAGGRGEFQLRETPSARRARWWRP